MTKHIVSLSGGVGSFVTAHLLAEAHGTVDLVFVFCDTTIEDPDLYRFLDDIESALGVDIIRLKDGRTPWEVFHAHRYQGNTRTAHCSFDLKGKVFGEWLRENYSPSECVVYFGFDWSEEHRLHEARKNWQPYQCEAPLCGPPYLSKQQKFQIIDDYGIEIPKLYKLGFTHNNCGGFCVKAGQAHFERLLRELPEVYKRHEEEQEKLMRDIPTTRPFLRKVEDKKLKYITLKEFREFLEGGGVVVDRSTGGCGCFNGGDK